MVVDVRDSPQLPRELTAFRGRHPNVGLVVILSTLDPQLMLEAMRIGVNECLAEPLTAMAAEGAIRRLLVKVAPQAPNQVLAFVGAKGGVGTTTLAVNTAVAVRQAEKHSKVLLIDAHVGSGEAALFLGAEPRFTILDALANMDRIDESFFGSLVENTKSGVRLLSASAQAIHSPLQVEQIRALFEAAAVSHETTVIDVPRMDSAMLDSLEMATAIVVVTGQEIASLRNAAHLTETLQGRYAPGKVKAVINRFQR